MSTRPRPTTRLLPLLLLLLTGLALPACGGDDDPAPDPRLRDRSPPTGDNGRGFGGGDPPLPSPDHQSSDPFAPGSAFPSDDPLPTPSTPGTPSSTPSDPPQPDPTTDPVPDPTGAPPAPGIDCATGFLPDFFDIAPACEIYAQSPSTLYIVDPWRGTAENIGPTTGNMFDIDVAPDGTLYGVASSALHRYEESTGRWTRVGALNPAGVNPNGLCINSFGVGYVTSGDQLYQVDLDTGRTTPAPRSMGSGFTSSGDCVIDKADLIYMTSSNTFGNDDLVLIDNDGAAQVIGRTNHNRIYGLTAAWGRLFGTTGDGYIIEIDWQTGHSRTLHRLAGIQFYGAASTAANER